jgi:glycosyltransferase involved in cell wall biosynthesis
LRVLLLANQPERTTRLKMFETTLKGLGYDVIVPSFGTKNWIRIIGLAKKVAKNSKADVVHVFNVPDIIYHNFAQHRGDFFKKFIYDYRSPWGLELQQTFGPPGRIFGEHFEQNLAMNADAITTVNRPLREKVMSYVSDTDVHIIPNYPSRSFSAQAEEYLLREEAGRKPIIFIGRVCIQEGIRKLLEIARSIPDQEFWIVGGGPFVRWHLWRMTPNVKYLGWQPHDRVASLVKKANLCLIPREDSVITPYSTDKSVWKLNEYLNMGRLVVASGIIQEQPRKNLIIVKSSELKNTIVEHLDEKPQRLTESDYRYWDSNTEDIREVYESLA